MIRVSFFTRHETISRVTSAVQEQGSNVLKVNIFVGFSHLMTCSPSSGVKLPDNRHFGQVTPNLLQLANPSNER